jgi:hypothetical protein
MQRHARLDELTGAGGRKVILLVVLATLLDRRRCFSTEVGRDIFCFPPEINMKAQSSYSVKHWDEVPYRDLSPETKLTKASVRYELTGDLQGIASVEYLMFYSHVDSTDPHKATASYVGLIHFDGTLSGQSGSFVLEDNGGFEAGAAVSRLRVAQGSGSGSLKGIQGTGMYRADKDGFRLELEYELR